MRLEINYRKKQTWKKKSQTHGKKNSQLNNQEITEEIKEEIKKLHRKK